jgi:hypothetical protein
LFESAITKTLTKIAVEQGLIPPQQMAFTGRNTTTALLYIETIVRAAWSAGKVATLLSLDMSGAFNRVDHTLLLKVLHNKGIPKPLIILIQSFLSSRSTTIKIPGSTSRSYIVNTGIPQGNPLSPILFLFFTAPLLEQLTGWNFGPGSLQVFAFSNDTGMLAVSDSFLTNSKILAAAMRAFNTWAMVVAYYKFEFMHFSRRSKDSKRKT